MTIAVSVRFAPGTEFSLSPKLRLGSDEARRWLDEQFVALGAEPMRASGKVLVADKVLAVASAAGGGGGGRAGGGGGPPPARGGPPPRRGGGRGWAPYSLRGGPGGGGAAGPRRDAAWADRYAASVVAALGRDVVRVETDTSMVTY